MVPRRRIARQLSQNVIVKWSVNNERCRWNCAIVYRQLQRSLFTDHLTVTFWAQSSLERQPRASEGVNELGTRGQTLVQSTANQQHTLGSDPLSPIHSHLLTPGATFFRR